VRDCGLQGNAFTRGPIINQGALDCRAVENSAQYTGSAYEHHRKGMRTTIRPAGGGWVLSIKDHGITVLFGLVRGHLLHEVRSMGDDVTYFRSWAISPALSASLSVPSLWLAASILDCTRCA
jgi:hypothetical protein